MYIHIHIYIYIYIYIHTYISLYVEASRDRALRSGTWLRARIAADSERNAPWPAESTDEGDNILDMLLDIL